jgi:hypothetical protein
MNYSRKVKQHNREKELNRAKRLSNNSYTHKQFKNRRRCLSAPQCPDCHSPCLPRHLVSARETVRGKRAPHHIGHAPKIQRVPARLFQNKIRKSTGEPGYSSGPCHGRGRRSFHELFSSKTRFRRLGLDGATGLHNIVCHLKNHAVAVR